MEHNTMTTWTPVCQLNDIIPDTGVAALVDGQQVAIFRLRNGALYAIDNYCPFARANVLSRGIVGSHQGLSAVASPMYKQRFDLSTGRCIDDANVVLKTWQVEVKDEQVVIGDIHAPLQAKA